MDLSDEQWVAIEPLIIRPPRRSDGKGRPRQDDRPILNAVFWMLRTGAAWPDLPKRYPPYQTCHRRFQEWLANDTLECVLLGLAKDLEERGQLKLAECWFDGSLVIARRGDRTAERPNEARLRRSWQMQTLLVLLSPTTLKLLARKRSPLLQMLSPQVLATIP